MESMAMTWHAARGWSCALPAALDSTATLVLAFGPTELLDVAGPIDDIRRAFPKATLAGASSGTAIGDGHIRDATLVVSVTRFDAARLEMVNDVAGHARATEDAFLGGRCLAEALCATEIPVAVLVLADGLLVNGPELVRGMLDALPAQVLLTGGMAGDGTSFGRTWVIADGSLRSGAATAVGLYGKRLRATSAFRGGSVGFGPRRRVTHASGNVVYELDGQPALQLYEQFLGDCASALPGSAAHFPLTVYRERQNEAPIIRYVLGIDRARQSITLAGAVPCGSIVQLSRAGRGELLRAADQVADEFARRGNAPRADLNIVVSCIGRRIVLGEQTDEEVELVAQALPEGASQVGFYSYGEISGSALMPCDMHNMTLALTSITESLPGARP